jgi:hypothetical protein
MTRLSSLVFSLAVRPLRDPVQPELVLELVALPRVASMLLSLQASPATLPVL